MTQCIMVRMCPASSFWVAGLLAVLGEVMGVMSGQRKGDQEKTDRGASLDWIKDACGAKHCDTVMGTHE